MMRILYLLAIAACFCSSVASAQGVKRNLVHLTKEQYSRQIEEGFEAAYADAHNDGYFRDVEVDSVTYDGYGYEWMIEMIDKVIDENFSTKITHSAQAAADITYRMTCRRVKKDVYIRVSLSTQDTPQGDVNILFGLMKLDGVSGIIRLTAAKKELRKIFESI
jgi:hypothetical protein